MAVVEKSVSSFSSLVNAGTVRKACRRALLLNAGYVLGQCMKNVVLIPKTGLSQFRRACLEACEHYLNPLNGIMPRAMDQLGKYVSLYGPDDRPTRRAVLSLVQEETARYENGLFKPTLSPLIHRIFDHSNSSLFAPR